MKTFTLALLFLSLSIPSFATIHFITSPGFDFSPATLTIQAGDTVIFDISGSHNVREVSQMTWDNNGNTQLPGGFSLPFGGGNLLPADLTVGTHFYVCQPHASQGMKGMITVEGTSSVSPKPTISALTISPNPTSGIVKLEVSLIDETEDYQIQVLSLTGREVYIKTYAGVQISSEINLGYLPRGMYILRIHVAGASEARKIILQ